MNSCEGFVVAEINLKHTKMVMFNLLLIANDLLNLSNKRQKEETFLLIR